MVAIIIDHMYFCGGVVLDAYTVLTAAHCTDGAQSFKIFFAGRMFSATRREEHPKWSASTIEGNLAKIYLEEELAVKFNAGNQDTRYKCSQRKYWIYSGFSSEFSVICIS